MYIETINNTLHILLLNNEIKNFLLYLKICLKEVQVFSLWRVFAIKLSYKNKNKKNKIDL